MKVVKKASKILGIIIAMGIMYFGNGLSYQVSAATVSGSNSDDTFATANQINMGDTASGSITETNDLDYYRFQLNSAGCVTLNMTSYMQYYCIKVFNSDGEEIWDTDENKWTESVGYRHDGYKLYLEKGIYYMQINGYRYDTLYKSTGRYECKTSFIASNVSFDGDDNSFGTAKSISWNKAYTGQISINDEFDTYKFVVPKDRTIAINMTSYMQYYCIVVFDSAGGEIWKTENNEWDNKVGHRKDFYNVELKKGTYYMQIYGGRYISYREKSQGKYVFSIEPLTQSNCNHKYTDKWVESTYFSQGYDLHKCEKCGKSYKDNYSPMKKLGQGYIYSYSYSGKGKAYLQWSTVGDASGYQIKYCKSKSMKKGVVTKTIKGQSKYKMTIKKLSRRKKYYFQVRAYKKSGKKMVYGKWSSRRCLRVK